MLHARSPRRRRRCFLLTCPLLRLLPLPATSAFLLCPGLYINSTRVYIARSFFRELPPAADAGVQSPSVLRCLLLGSAGALWTAPAEPRDPSLAGVSRRLRLFVSSRLCPLTTINPRPFTFDPLARSSKKCLPFFARPLLSIFESQKNGRQKCRQTRKLQFVSIRSAKAAARTRPRPRANKEKEERKKKKTRHSAAGACIQLSRLQPRAEE